MLTTWKTITRNGLRSWQAESAAHAIEQHEDAFRNDPSEEVLAVLRGDLAGRRVKITHSRESYVGCAALPAMLMLVGMIGAVLS